MSIKRVSLLLMICLLIGLFVYQTAGVPSLLQYAFLPPELKGAEKAEESTTQQAQEQEEKPEGESESPLKQFLKSWDSLLEDQGTALQSGIISAHLPSADLSTKQGGATQAELTALYGSLHALPESVLINGRRLYQEEVQTGKPVALINEALAIALFRQGNPVNMTFTFSGQEFTVVGIIRQARTLGDRANNALFVPLKAFENQPNWEMMLAQLRLNGGSGTRKGVATSLQAWQSGGQTIDLVKEKYRATLAVRVFLCVLGFLLALFFVRLSAQVSSSMIASNKARLQDEYAIRLLPRFIGVGLLILLMFALGVGTMVFAFSKLLEPVYVFPEWVPAILVEPREIAATFWNNLTMNSGLVSLRSRELLFLQRLGGFITVLTLLFAWGLVVPLHKLFLLVKKVPAQEEQA